MYSYWSADRQTLGCTKLLISICQLSVIWNVDVGFNNCHMSDMTDHLTQCPWPALVVLVFLLQLPLFQGPVWWHQIQLIYNIIEYMKFGEQ